MPGCARLHATYSRPLVQGFLPATAGSFRLEEKMAPEPYAYFNGDFVPLNEAKVSVMTNAFDYGTGCFEGIRGNWNAAEEQLYVFRLREHYERLLRSCKILKIVLPHTVDELCRIAVDLVKRNGYREDMYLRPVSYTHLRAHETRHDLVCRLL